MRELERLGPKKIHAWFMCVFDQHVWLRMDRDFWRCKYCGKIKTKEDIKGKSK